MRRLDHRREVIEFVAFLAEILTSAEGTVVATGDPCEASLRVLGGIRPEVGELREYHLSRARCVYGRSVITRSTPDGLRSNERH